MSNVEGAPAEMPGLGEALGGPAETPSTQGQQPPEATSPPAEAAKPPEGEAKPLEGEAKAEGEAKPAVFDDTKLSVPEGIKFEGEARTEFAEIAKGLPQETAQKMLDLGSKMLKAAAEESSRLWATTNESWVAEMKGDKEIGGAKLDAEVRPGIAKLFDEYVGPIGSPQRTALIQAMDMTGAGNNPAVARFLWNVSKALNEGKPVPSGTPGKQMPVDAAHAMYPNLP